jgi:hypothetical protein
MTNGIIRARVLALLLAALLLAGGARAQEQSAKPIQPVKPILVKGGHELGESAEQFFAEGHEKEALAACAVGDFKSVNKSSRRQLKQYCAGIADDRRQAMSGKRYEYKTGGDPSELRVDTFTFDGGRLVKVELIFSAPSLQVNYRGQRFDEIFAGIKQAYGPPTNESTAPVKNTYGVESVAHRETWVLPQGAILVTEQPGEDGSTTLVALTRAEYDRTVAAGAPKAANPLQ